ncbi:MAG: heavy metal-associated domain-containing protein, partial [Myxococcota bacterium]|nr:heavy metal-associated domain-containing protein [Myxococcota bacterium]
MIISSLAARAGLQAQRIRIVSLTLGLLLLPSLASAEVLVIDVEGMTCAGCRTKVKESLTELPFIGTVTTSIAGETVCAETQGTRDDAAVNTAIEGLGYRVAALELQPACPAELSRTPDPWDNRTDGLDVQVISQGEKVDLKGHLVDDKFTIIDFGAPW